MRANVPTSTTLEGRQYWRSLEELADAPEFREFLEKEYPDSGPSISDPVTRRSFLGVMGAAFAMAGLVGCRRPLAKILPYSKAPEDLLPGNPQMYATVWPWRGFAEGLLVESTEGRPSKIEGNPDHPGSLGATHHFAQASLLEMYDPDRSQQVLRGGSAATWEDFQTWARQNLAGRRGNGVAILRGSNASPAVEAMEAELRTAWPQATWHTFEPVNRDGVIEGARTALGSALRQHVDYEQADVILSLDADFLFMEPNAVRQARGFARGRRISSEKDSMNRLYMVENGFTVTGAMADHRMRLPASTIAEFGAALAVKLASTHQIGLSGVDMGVLRQSASARQWTPEQVKWLDAVAADLAGARGRCVVVAGGRQPAELHALLHAVNRGLGAVGPVVRYTRETDPGKHTESIQELAVRLQAGGVDTLIVLGSNPVYDAPADLNFADALGKARHVIHLGLYADETAAAAEWHLPLAHYLESWGDGRAWDGTLGVQQPLIAPLYGGRSMLEVLAMLAGRTETDGYLVLTDLYRSRWGAGEFETRWNRALHDGLIAGTADPEVPGSVDGAAVTAAWRNRAPGAAVGAGAFEVVFVEDPSVYDGRFANLGWLQELPDPMTKLVWDNAAYLSPATARELGIEKEGVVTISVGDRSVSTPVWIVPGHADHSISLHLGYGRTASGRVGNGAGFDVYPLRTTATMSFVTGVTVTPTGRVHPLASTQDHFAMEGRPLAREGTLHHYREHPDFVEHMEEVFPEVNLYTGKEYDYTQGHQWGLTVDLNTCTGCNACVTACQSENNISVVGKDEVIRGREMHWIRLDRYFVGEEDNPEAVQQPVLCQQCENAPCEAVCPVQATVHSDEGLNDMVYNRCIGTRYCSNNCPYKVRRFNFFDWNKNMTEVEKMSKNPEVTVRMRGVMEKCTFCVQRISRKRIERKVQGDPIADGDILTACQQVCPTESIVFGDVNDPASRVSQLKKQNRNYSLLGWLNTKPRTTYLARIRNPNPELEHA